MEGEGKEEFSGERNVTGVVDIGVRVCGAERERDIRGLMEGEGRGVVEGEWVVSGVVDREGQGCGIPAAGR